MKGPARRKCLCCKEFYRPDQRNLRHQRYCSKPACRKESEAQSQFRWQQRPENQNYFRGPENRRRVKEWRKRNPGYWRKSETAVLVVVLVLEGDVAAILRTGIRGVLVQS